MSGVCLVPLASWWFNVGFGQARPAGQRSPGATHPRPFRFYSKTAHVNRTPTRQSEPRPFVALRPHAPLRASQWVTVPGSFFVRQDAVHLNEPRDLALSEEGSSGRTWEGRRTDRNQGCLPKPFRALNPRLIYNLKSTIWNLQCLMGRAESAKMSRSFPKWGACP